VTLSSGGLDATFVPELNMLGTSLRLEGEGFIALPGGVAAYRSRHATGLPLLAPWANRLSAWSYRSAGVRADLRDADLSTDPNGLPIHGTMWGEAWQIESISARGRAARLRATFDYGRADLLTAFPFPHRVAAEIDVDEARRVLAELEGRGNGLEEAELEALKRDVQKAQARVKLAG